MRRVTLKIFSFYPEALAEEIIYSQKYCGVSAFGPFALRLGLRARPDSG
jgi:hypothetical protein